MGCSTDVSDGRSRGVGSLLLTDFLRRKRRRTDSMQTDMMRSSGNCQGIFDLQKRERGENSKRSRKEGRMGNGQSARRYEKILTVYRSDFIFTGWVEQVTFELTTADGR